MDYKRIENTVVVRLDPGDDIVTELLVIAEKETIALGTISGLGAVNECELGLFDVETKKYHSNIFRNQNFEIVSLIGNLSMMDNEHYLHLHMAIGDVNGHVFGGHLNRGIISATGEIIITIIPGNVTREFSDTIGLNIFDFQD